MRLRFSTAHTVTSCPALNPCRNFQSGLPTSQTAEEETFNIAGDNVHIITVYKTRLSGSTCSASELLNVNPSTACKLLPGSKHRCRRIPYPTLSWPPRAPL